MVPFYLRSLLSCVVHIIGVFYLKFEIFFWNLSVVVYTYPCSQRCPWISKVTKPASLSRAHGGQAVCLARGQAGHSSPLIISVRTRRPIGSWRSHVWCKQGHSFCSGRALGLPGLPVAIQEPCGLHRRGPIHLPSPQRATYRPHYFLTTPGASRSVWLGVHTWRSDHLVETQTCSLKNHVCLTLGNLLDKWTFSHFLKKGNRLIFVFFLCKLILVSLTVLSWKPSTSNSGSSWVDRSPDQRRQSLLGSVKPTYFSWRRLSPSHRDQMGPDPCITFPFVSWSENWDSVVIILALYLVPIILVTSRSYKASHLPTQCRAVSWDMSCATLTISSGFWHGLN